MSEVEKMYELAGIENYSIKGWTGFVPNKYKIIADDDDNVIDIVLDFTAEKQLSLIKWLAVKGDFDSSIDIAKNTYNYWTIYFQGARWTAEGFEESLAGLINNLWQDLTEQERTEIAEILRG